MKELIAFIFGLGVMGALSLPYESWGLPVWPVALMTLLTVTVLSLIPGLEKVRLPLAIVYFTVFALLWLQSFPRPITPKATLLYLRGLVWMATYTIFGIVAAISIFIALAKSFREKDTSKATVFALAAIFMGGIVAFVSGPGAGADPMLSWFKSLGLSESMSATGVFLFRKGVHFTYYGVMAMMAGLAAHHGRLGKKGIKPIVIGFVFMLIHAVFDEVRQSGVSIRTGSGMDVLLDCAGGAFFLWLAIGRKDRRLKGAPAQ